MLAGSAKRTEYGLVCQVACVVGWRERCRSYQRATCAAVTLLCLGGAAYGAVPESDMFANAPLYAPASVKRQYASNITTSFPLPRNTTSRRAKGELRSIGNATDRCRSRFAFPPRKSCFFIGFRPSARKNARN